MSEWIKCSEQMPPTKKLVLVAIKKEIRPAEFTFYRRIGFYTKGNEIEFDEDDSCEYGCPSCEQDVPHFLSEGWHQEIDEHGSCDGYYDSLPNVTHWMPLPEHPRD